MLAEPDTFLIRWLRPRKDKKRTVLLPIHPSIILHLIISDLWSECPDLSLGKILDIKLFITTEHVIGYDRETCCKSGSSWLRYQHLGQTLSNFHQRIRRRSATISWPLSGENCRITKFSNICPYLNIWTKFHGPKSSSCWDIPRLSQSEEWTNQQSHSGIPRAMLLSLIKTEKTSVGNC